MLVTKPDMESIFLKILRQEQEGISRREACNYDHNLRGRYTTWLKKMERKVGHPLIGEKRWMRNKEASNAENKHTDQPKRPKVHKKAPQPEAVILQPAPLPKVVDLEDEPKNEIENISSEDILLLAKKVVYDKLRVVPSPSWLRLAIELCREDLPKWANKALRKSTHQDYECILDSLLASKNKDFTIKKGVNDDDNNDSTNGIEQSD